MPIDETERKRRRDLVHAHMAAENAHDLEAIVATFSADASGMLNQLPISGDEPIRQAHVLLGLSSAPGALLGTRIVPQREHISDDEIIIEGRVVAQHVGPFFGLPPTNAQVELFYAAVYRFDADGKLASERVKLDLGPLDARWKPSP